VDTKRKVGDHIHHNSVGTGIVRYPEDYFFSAEWEIMGEHTGIDVDIDQSVQRTLQRSPSDFGEE
jgi:hypothetical protein